MGDFSGAGHTLLSVRGYMVVLPLDLMSFTVTEADVSGDFWKNSPHQRIRCRRRPEGHCENSPKLFTPAPIYRQNFIFPTSRSKKVLYKLPLLQHSPKFSCVMVAGKSKFRSTFLTPPSPPQPPNF